MRYPSTENRITGLIGMIFGLVPLVVFALSEKGNLLIDESDFFFVKYFVFILFINGGLVFFVFGILLFLGILLPYYSEKTTSYEKSKQTLLMIILSIPIWLSTSSVILLLSRKPLFRIAWVLILICIGLAVVSSFKALRKGSSKNKQR